MASSRLSSACPASGSTNPSTRHSGNRRHGHEQTRKSRLERLDEGTSFFINGEGYEGPYTADALLATIQGGAIPEIEPMSRLPWARL